MCPFELRNTLNIYEHILEQGKEQVARCVSDIILKKHDTAQKQKLVP